MVIAYRGLAKTKSGRDGAFGEKRLAGARGHAYCPGRLQADERPFTRLAGSLTDGFGSARVFPTAGLAADSVPLWQTGGRPATLVGAQWRFSVGCDPIGVASFL